MIEWPADGPVRASSYGARDSHLLFDIAAHQKAGHFPSDKDCAICQRAFAQRQGAYKGGLSRSQHVNLATMNVDLIDWGAPDNNGNRYTLTAAICETSFPAVRQMNGKSGIETASKVREIKGEIECLSDVGDHKGYRIQRIHKDQGSEFKSQHVSDCRDDKIWSTTGEEAAHTNGAVVEGSVNKHLEYTATALGMTCFHSTDLSQQVHGELVGHACDLLRLRNRTPFQKENNISAWKEQTLTEPDFTIRDACRFGSFAFGYVKKEDRENKLSNRSYPAIFAGWDKQISGAVRLIPYVMSTDGDTVVFGKTKVTKRYKLYDGNFPLGVKGREGKLPHDDCAPFKWIGEEDEVGAAAEGAPEEDWAVEAIIGKSIYDTETGDCEYHCTFVGYDSEHDLWIDRKELCCDQLIAAYEERENPAHAYAAELQTPEKKMTNLTGSQNATEAQIRRAEAAASPHTGMDVHDCELEIEFEAKIAFANYHNCDPHLVSVGMLKRTTAGLQAYRQLWKEMMQQEQWGEVDDNDWQWVIDTLQQDGPLSEVALGYAKEAMLWDYMHEEGLDLDSNEESDEEPEEESDDEMPVLEDLSNNGEQLNGRMPYTAGHLHTPAEIHEAERAAGVNPGVDAADVEIEEEFEAKMAFSYLHNCDPYRVTTGLLRST